MSPADAEVDPATGAVAPARSFLGVRVKTPTAWDIGAYLLGLYCLGHEAGLLPAPAANTILGWFM